MPSFGGTFAAHRRELRIRESAFPRLEEDHNHLCAGRRASGCGTGAPPWLALWTWSVRWGSYLSGCGGPSVRPRGGDLSAGVGERGEEAVMQISNAGLNLIKIDEGFKPHLYNCRRFARRS